MAEDEEIVALEISQELSAAGFEVAGPFATCADVAAWLSEATPWAAVLDIQLRDGACLDALRQLVEAGVPTIVCSADTVPDEFREVTAMEKPMDPRRLVRSLLAYDSAAAS